jgi:hypothetical protein
MPRLNQKRSMFRNQPLNLVYFMIGESEIFGKFNRLQPEFRDVPITFHVDVDGLATIRAEKHETVRTDPENRWHPMSSP